MWKPSRSGLHGNEQKRRYLKLMGPTKRRLVRLIAVTSSGHSRLHTSFDLFDRQLHEYSPAEGWRDRRVSGEHVAAENVFGFLHRLAAAHASRARSPHLGELRHVGVAENEAAVRMCNQAAIRID